jgi:putative PIN family toxin of toxin-antitoxin system
MCVVLDTNVFVSVILGNRLQAIFDYWRSESFVLVVSNEIVQEYLGVLRRRKFHLTLEIIDPIMAQIFRHAEFVTPEIQVRLIEADPSDNIFLEAAVVGETAYIISGDNHLLDLKSLGDIRIITAREFLSILDRES